LKYKNVITLTCNISGWQKIYSNDVYKLITDRGVELTEKVKKQVLGGEVAMWSEQVNITHEIISGAD
jgi:hypothetical protein